MRLYLLVLLLTVPTANAATEGGGGVRVVAHSEENLQKLDREYLRALFTLQIASWPDGEPVRVYVFNETHPAHLALCKEILGLYPYILRQAWDKTLFTGTGLVPEELDSESEMLRRVAATPGAIGYVTDAVPRTSLQKNPKNPSRGAP